MIQFSTDYSDLFPKSLPALVVAGGVAANKYISKHLCEIAAESGFRLFVPPENLCTDNAAMIAWAAIERNNHNDDDSDELDHPAATMAADALASPPPGRGVRA